MNGTAARAGPGDETLEVLALALLLDDDLVVKAAVKPIDREREKVAQAREAIQRQFGEFFAHLSLHLATIARGIRKGEEEDDPVLAAAEAADYAGTVNAAKPHLREVAKDGAGHGLAQVGAGGHETLMQAHQRAVDWSEERAGELVGGIEETTREGVRDLVARALAEGWTNDELAQALLDSGLFSASRAEMIARTEVASADVAGSLIGWKESGVVSGKEWKTGGDACDECQELDGEVVALEDDFPDGDPPLHPNCVLPGTLVSAVGVSAHYKRWFRGEVVRLVVEGDDQLAVTPNHPVLTVRGWILAGELRESDHLIQAFDPGAAVRAVDPDNHHVQASIEEIAGALLMAGGMVARRVPVTAEDFHGDVSGGEYVDVVGPEGLLLHGGQATTAQLVGDEVFRRAGVRKTLLLRRGDLATVVHGLALTADGVVGGSGEARAVIRGDARHPGEHRLAHRSHFQPGAAESVAQRQAVATEFPRKVDARLAGHVSGVDSRHLGICESPPDRSRLRLRARLVPGLSEPSNDHLRGDVETAANGIDRLAGLVRPVKIVDIRRSYWAGHVYNLQTSGGWYFASGVVVHNCRCDVLPVLSDEEE